MRSRLTEAQKRIVRQILETGHVSLSRDSSDDYVAASAFIFDNGLFFTPDAYRAALKMEGRDG